jgi:hypothetical protein
MSFLNPRFSIPGDNPGEASNWTLTTYTSAERIAGFGPEPHTAWEDFERWFEFWSNLDQVEIALAFFDPRREAVEDFEEAWDNDFYYFELPLSHIIWAIFDGREVDDFETGWENGDFAWSWEDVTSHTAIFDGYSFERFETGWRGNETFIWYFDDAPSDVALFDSGTKPYEDFSGDWTEPDTGTP